jgi:hypothetical protein
LASSLLYRRELCFETGTGYFVCLCICMSLVASSAVAAPPETNPNYTTIEVTCDGETLTLVETGGAVAFVQGTSQPGIAMSLTVFADTDGDGVEEVVFQSSNKIGQGVEGLTVMCTGSFVDEQGLSVSRLPPSSPAGRSLYFLVSNRLPD